MIYPSVAGTSANIRIIFVCGIVCLLCVTQLLTSATTTTEDVNICVKTHREVTHVIVFLDTTAVTMIEIVTVKRSCL